MCSFWLTQFTLRFVHVAVGAEGAEGAVGKGKAVSFVSTDMVQLIDTYKCVYRRASTMH